MNSSLPLLFRRGCCWIIPGLLLLLLLLCAGNARAQAPTWQSAVAASGAQVYAVAADAGGNVYLAGSFGSSATFGNITLTGGQQGDIFVAKWSETAGRFLWAQQAGGIGNDWATGIAVSGNSVFIVGDFTSPTIRFGAGTLTNTNSTLPTADVFVAKLTDAGTTASFTWARQAGGFGVDFATDVAVSGSSIYFTGYYESSTMTFGSNVILNPMTPGVTSTDLFVAKLTDAGSTGTFDWVRGAGGVSNEVAYSIATAGSSVYVVGYFTSVGINLGTTLFNTQVGSEDGFVAKLDTSGSFIWALRIGGTGSESPMAVAASGNDVFVAGMFTSTPALFGSTTLALFGSTTLAPVGGPPDAFVAKVTDAGTSAAFAWSQWAGGPGIDTPRAIAAIGTDVYVTGYFNSPTASFGGTTLVNVAPPGTTANDIFVGKLTGTGNFVGAVQAGSPANDYAYDIATNGSTVYIADNTALPAAFGSTILQGGSDAGFLASLSTSVLATTEPSPVAELLLYPNPAHKSTTVVVPALAGQGNGVLTLTDGVGRILAQHHTGPTAAGLRYTLPLDGLSPGLYLLRVQTEHGQLVRQLVVE
ncbi:T9SS type A sorting domain-containing protein [Hymenobacter convexus]|uniref:T9SS type A sorting domain-containing protein n=1 Tax=Hymenobacter sp. CA1UV-4 TaxID=3063782 RepID=UPI0027144840|nr:T9SS type A sorting domain-containing protein [Hymenobacter sp. CA1UV-4]MDO7852514.1 T9SS type A sorting domain-containing protein [Hymenobacter sp. CA1UV-4]